MGCARQGIRIALGALALALGSYGQGTVNVSWVFGAAGSFAYVLQSVAPPDAGLGTVGGSNPTLTLRLGWRYEVEVTDRSMHPLEIIGKAAEAGSDRVLLSMAAGVEGSLEGDSGIGWEDSGLGAARFTMTRGLYAAMVADGRQPGYRCRPHAGSMRGALAVVGLPLADPIPAAIPLGGPRVELETVAAGLAAPVALVAVPGPSSRLLVADQVGLVYRIDGGSLRSPPFLDVRALLVSPLGILGGLGEDDYDERGLLGLAVHPGYEDPASPGYGRLYTFTSEPLSGPADMTCGPLPQGVLPDHQNVITEWQADPDDPNRALPGSRRVLLRIDHPQFNHNGGMLGFGPDGYLHIALGDGGNANDRGPGHGEQGNGQNPQTPHGSLLRIDPIDPARTPDRTDPPAANGRYRVAAGNPFAGTDGLDEILAFGFRNPFAFSFDLPTGRLVVADVGQNHVEEIDVVVPGGNYGWSLKEGTFRFDAATGDVTDDLGGLPAGLVDPVAQYDHDEGLAIVGGHVYRGADLPALQGLYVCGDFSRGFGAPAGRLLAADLGTGALQQLRLGSDDRPLGLYVRGFGRDSRGELHLLASRHLGPAGHGGLVLRLVADRFGPARLTVLADVTALPENGGAQSFTVARSLQDSSGPVDVSLTASSPGVLTVPAVVSFTAGQEAVQVPVAPVDTGVFEGDRGVSLTLSAPGFEPADIGLTVADDEAPSVTGVSPGTAAGAGSGTVVVAEAVALAEGSVLTFAVAMAQAGRPYRYLWTLDGQPAPGAADSSSFAYNPGYDGVQHPARSRDARLVCAIRSADGGGTATATWASVRILDTDRSPPAPRVAITPAAPRTGDDLDALVVQQGPDPDGDAVTGHEVLWEPTGGGGTIAGSRLSHGHTRKAQTWQATVRALSDPYGDGSAASPIAGTAATTIGNTPPLAVSQWGLTLPASTALALQLQGSDPDADEGVDTLGFLLLAGPGHGSLPDFDAASGTATYIPADGYSGSDRVSFAVGDGTDHSAAGSIDLYVSGGWVVTLRPVGGGLPVQVGVEADATAGVDVPFDLEAHAPAPGVPRLVALADVGKAGASAELARDIRGPEPWPAWLLKLAPAGADLVVSWADSDLPQDGLWLWEVATADPDAPPLAGTLVDMAATRELRVAAGPERYVVVAPFRIWSLALAGGWNLVSLPGEPEEPAVEAVLASASGAGGTVHAGYVWTADGASPIPQYVPVRELHALTGYWLFVPTPITVRVRAQPVGRVPVRLRAGWNLVAVPFTTDLPDDPVVLRPAWGWEDGGYRAVTRLEPGLGYWLLCTRKTLWDPAP